MLLVFSFVFVSFPQIGVVKAESKTIVVPDDFPTIQEAVDNAMAGDTVFVKKGTYNVGIRLIIDKSLSLIGEDRQETVITVNLARYPSYIIFVEADNVTISNITIAGKRNRNGITIGYTGLHYSSITDNTILNCSIGIGINDGRYNSSIGAGNFSAFSNIISGNKISGCGDGIRISSTNTIVTGNEITGNYHGIGVNSQYVNIIGNNITNNIGGVILDWWGPYNVSGNNISENSEVAVSFARFCNNSTIIDNTIANNGIGFRLYKVPNIGKGNRVYHNNIIDNQQQVAVNITYAPSYVTNGTDIVLWDNGAVGNYWSDYNGPDNNEDKIGDSPYIIDGNNQDNYPLTEHFEFVELKTPNVNSTFPTWAILLSIIVIVLLAVIIYHQYKSHSKRQTTNTA